MYLTQGGKVEPRSRVVPIVLACREVSFEKFQEATFEKIHEVHTFWCNKKPSAVTFEKIREVTFEKMHPSPCNTSLELEYRILS